MHYQLNFSHSRLPETVLSVAMLCLRSTRFNFRPCIFQNFLRSIPPGPPRRLMLCISECALHTAGEPTYTYIETSTSFWLPFTKVYSYPTCAYVLCTQSLQLYFQHVNCSTCQPSSYLGPGIKNGLVMSLHGM